MSNAIYITPSAGSIATMRDRLIAAAIVGATLAALVYLFLFNPASGSAFYPSCPLRLLTGFYCPGCGTLRGLHQLLHGHLFGALSYNPLMVATLPFIGYAYLSYTMLALRGSGLPRVFVPPVLIKALFWVVIAFGVLRNIPAYPFSLLAP
jgi:hypothetical protein